MAFHTKGLNRYEWETSVHYPTAVFPKQMLEAAIIPAAYSDGKVDFYIYICHQDLKKR